MKASLYIIIILIVVAIFLLKTQNEKFNNYKKIDYYIPNRQTELDFLFGGYPYWYSDLTPLPFNNPTRFSNYMLPRLQDYIVY